MLTTQPDLRKYRIGLEICHCAATLMQYFTSRSAARHLAYGEIVSESFCHANDIANEGRNIEDVLENEL